MIPIFVLNIAFCRPQFWSQRIIINWYEFIVYHKTKKNLKLMKALLYIAGEEINGSNLGISKDFHIIKHNILHFIDKANKNEWGDDLLCSYIYPSTYLDRWLSTPSLHIRAFLKVFLKCQITINWGKCIILYFLL